MRKAARYYGLSLLSVLLSAATGQAMDQPHWYPTLPNGCTNCHRHGVMSYAEPCTYCHTATPDLGDPYVIPAPEVSTHSSTAVDSGKYGVWSIGCRGCHDEDKSDQFGYLSPLVQGTFSSYTQIPQGGSDVLYVFAITGLAVNDAEWADPARWSAKTGPNRGLTLWIKRMSGSWYSLVIKDATSSTITARGDSYYAPFDPSASFEIHYGQLIDNYPLPYGGSTRVDVVFNGPASFAKNDGLAGDIDSDGFADDSTPDGICQICHTETRYWRRDGTLSTHNDGSNCTGCHDHTKGFGANCNSCHGNPPVVDTAQGGDGLVAMPSETGSVTAGAHELHATPSGFNFACDMCHAGGMPDSPISGNNKIQIGFGVNPAGIPSSYDGQANLAVPYSYEGTGNTTVTGGNSLTCANVYCHSNGAYISTGNFNSHVTPSWNTPGPLGCDSCHPYPMSYGPEDPRKDTHAMHTSKGYGDCGLCHYANITNHTLHSNKVYDVNPSPTFQGRPADGAVPLSFTYAFAPGGGTCSSNSCHAYWGYSDPAKWGVNTELVVIPYLSGLPSPDIDRTVTFDGGRSACYENVDGVPQERTCTYTWDFGGSGNVTGGNGSDVMIYQYAAEGTYTAS
ncbi:MAG: CxxxxCH/CxxCH domain-containing protein, partial [Deltaproteobacteria bacterium]|nr:CxxxxCH/CxxCH domain-containing protein [Deltaproteobacteria bacterium]